MHSIRSKAHRAAWSNDGSSMSWNPYARIRPRPIGDAENPNDLRRYRSEAAIEPAIEGARHAEGRQAEREFPAPRHADTAPESTTTEKAPILDYDGTRATQQDTESLQPVGTGEESPDASEATVNGGHQHGARMRKHLKFLPGKHHDEKSPAAPTGLLQGEEMDREARKKAALKKKIPISSQFRAVVLGSWINVLLIFVPLGFILYYIHLPNQGVAVFVINFFAIIPLAAILSYATEELALRVGETLGGLLNASFGNAVELIVSVQALIKNEITIVKTSLIGSMLSNLLLVMGMAFFLGGLTRLEQFFNVTVAQTAASLLALCIGSLIIPTVFHLMLTSKENLETNINQELSRGTAVILLLVYAAYLIFQLKSHVEMYNAPSQKVAKRKSSTIEEGAALRGIAHIGAGTAAATGGRIHENHIVHTEEEEEEIEEPQLSVIGALVTLAISTTLVAFCSEFMVSSIESVTEGGTVSKTFVGLILLPIVGNAAEHATAVTVAMKDKMDLAIGVAVGSSMQIALLVLPLIVVLGWILDKDCMTLYFDIFQIAVLFVAVLLVNYLIQDGKSHWLEGVLLIASYLIIALSAWFYPHSSIDTRCPERE